MVEKCSAKILFLGGKIVHFSVKLNRAKIADIISAGSLTKNPISKDYCKVTVAVGWFWACNAPCNSCLVRAPSHIISPHPAPHSPLSPLLMRAVTSKIGRLAAAPPRFTPAKLHLQNPNGQLQMALATNCKITNGISSDVVRQRWKKLW